MIQINGFMESWIDDQDAEDIQVNVILDVDVSDEFYRVNDLEQYGEDEHGGYPRDRWSIWFTQNEEEREDKTAWIYLSHGNEDTNFMTEDQIQIAIDYVKQHGLDEKYGLVLA